MASPNPSDNSKIPLLSLPDETISKIFGHISPTMKDTLQFSIDAINLASTNKRLQRIFSSRLKKITPILQHLNAPALSQKHLGALIKHAGQNLRELHVPTFTHRYVPNLPDICPNIEVLHMLNLSAHQYFKDNGENHANDMSQVVAILPRLNLRKLSITAPPEEIFNVLRNHVPEELHFHGVTISDLPLLVPLLSCPLKALTVVTHQCTSSSFDAFIDNLYKAVPNIQSLTIHGPPNKPFTLDIEPMGNPPTAFKDEVAPLITSVREYNQTDSKCTSIDIRGIDSLRLLNAVNKNAVITVSLWSLTLRDEVSTGTYITSLALDNSLCDQDMSRLETVFLMSPSREGPAYWTNPLWSNGLKNHRTKVVRAYVAEPLNHLELSTEILKLSTRVLRDVTNWKILSGVKELYLLDMYSLDLVMRDDQGLARVLQALPSMVDAFRGDLIWAENILGGGCSRSLDALHMEQAALPAAVEAVNRFIMRGGDAASLQTWLNQVAQSLRSFSEVSHHSFLLNSERS